MKNDNNSKKSTYNASNNNNSNENGYGHGHAHVHAHGHGHMHGDLHHSIYEEFVHHLPYAILSAALALMFLSFTSFIAGMSEVPSSTINYYYFNLFHNFHLLHILFAASGTILAFSRFSKSFLKTLIIGFLSPAFFCILSDIFIPYLAGKIVGIQMEMHICFLCPHDSLSIFTFLALGVFNGLVLRRHSSTVLNAFLVGSHFMHILISALASLFYMVSHGFDNWPSYIAYIFIFLIIAVIIPCTFSDVIVPVYFGGISSEQERP